MAFSLYAATVPTFIQVSEAIAALLDKAEAFAADRGWAAGEFLMGFSVPNFHFHASMAYAILRKDGAPIGKRDYMGALPLKG